MDGCDASKQHEIHIWLLRREFAIALVGVADPRLLPASLPDCDAEKAQRLAVDKPSDAA